MSNKTALLIIDAQVNMFAEDYPVFDGGRLLQKLAFLIDRARRAGCPVVYVQNNGGAGEPDQPGTPGWQIHPALAPQPGDWVIQKHTPDAFFDTPLQRELEGCAVSRLVIAGMQTDMCIEATCRRASALGYEVILVKDAHSTFDGNTLTAAQIIAQYNDALSVVAGLAEAANVTFE